MIYAGFKFTELIRLAYGVLDWGLGHATRSVPIINALINKGINPLLVVSGQSGHYLKSVFPFLKFETLPNSDIVYRKGVPVWRSVLFQVPQLNQLKEQAHLCARDLADQGFTHFISDNLYGFYSPQAKSALITHQTSPAFPISFPGSEWLSARLIHQLIEPFDQVWIPLEPESRPLIEPLIKSFHKSLSFIGWLTALEKLNNQADEVAWMIALSGPEWYRTDLEEKLLKHWPASIKVHFVRGTNKPLNSDLQIPNSILLHNQLNYQLMSKLWFSTQYIVARSGYSTVMDALSTSKTGIWIPTPGQTEQLLLARKLSQLNRGIFLPQDRIAHIHQAIQKVEAQNSDIITQPVYQNRLLDVALTRFLHE